MSRFIIDCDPGHDDAVAVLVACRFLDVVGLTTVFGNSTVDNTTRNALAILDAADLSHIPVAKGADGPLEGRRHSGETVHGKSGLDGAELPASSRRPEAVSAIEFIAAHARLHDDLAIIAVAPLTNIASALIAHPDLRERITHISIMGGSTTFGNATAAAEFNVFADPEAAAIVFDAGIPLTMVGLDVTTTFGITREHVDTLRAHGSTIAREIGGALRYYLGRQSAIYERAFAPVHDVCAVLPFTHPALIRHEPMHVVVECEGKYTRGMTVCDRRGVVAGDGIARTAPPNADVAVWADGDTIIRIVLDTLMEFS